ncbi:hypothetical protein BBF96_05590 [Anoxybacter fermentans]|uniref:Bacterial repeat domain-containing protein n=1 Tax=Anoxybacter fermentans TaxID=1323375 RepID=A0A3S9SXC8_9FIRM|nr:leucine-rich repeat domain-containing protein [Anoxybacter fermentans]AZR72908.1 hypothetical protein BBF96_05590 [Anoxybacter fermentans]
MNKKKVIGIVLFFIMVGILAGCSSTNEFNELMRFFKVNIAAEGKGKVTKNPDQSLYEKGTKVTLNAIPEEGWKFKSWKGDITGSTNPVNITVDKNNNVIAVFEIDEDATFILNIDTIGEGTVTVDPEGENYKIGTKVTLTAQPADNWIFDRWDGDVTEKEKNPTTIYMDGNKEVKAIFVEEIAITGIKFADPNLERAVRDAINKPTGPIMPEDVKDLYSLDASYISIDSLEGIEYLTSLTWLDLSDNNISDISYLAELSNLVYLDLRSNSISNISPLANLINLEQLDLSNNLISDITSLKLKNLTELNLAGNLITDISVLSGLTALNKLTLSDNQINDIRDLSDLTNLIELDLSGNQIDDISVFEYFNLKNMEKLDLSENKLSNIDGLVWLGDGNLKEIDLSGNQIGDINVLHVLTQLEKINLSYNQIRDIGVLGELTNIRELDLSHNVIEVIDGLSNLNKLENLYLESNQIIDIYVLLDLSSLQIVNIMDNPNLDLSQGSPASQVIDTLRQRGVKVLCDG